MQASSEMHDMFIVTNVEMGVEHILYNASVLIFVIMRYEGWG